MQTRILFLVAALSFFSGGCGKGGDDIPPPPPGTKPTISISPASATVPLGGSKSFAFSVTGSPTPTVVCPVSGPGSVSLVSTSGATYSVPTAKPAVWTATVNCTATNSEGSASASAQITLEYPTPTVTDTLPLVGSLPREGVVLTEVRGSGFYPGGTLTFDDYGGLVCTPNFCFASVTITLGSNVAFDKVIIPFAFDTPHFVPRGHKVAAQSPADGHGGGVSDTLHFAFGGYENVLVPVEDKGFVLVLDRVRGKILKFSASDGSPLGEFTSGAGFANDFSVDNETGLVVWARLNGVIGVYDSGLPVVGVDVEGQVSGISAANGYSCFLQDLVGLLSSFKLEKGNKTVISESVGDTPLAVSAYNSPQDGLTCAVYAAGDKRFSVVKVPEMNTLRSLNIANLTSVHALPSGSGGWPMEVFRGGPQAGKTALLAQTDRSLVFVKMDTGEEVRRVVLDGAPFGIATDDQNGTVVVSSFDKLTGRTKYAEVSVSDGSVRNLEAAVDFFAAGLGVSTDGKKLYIAGFVVNPDLTLTITVRVVEKK